MTGRHRAGRRPTTALAPAIGALALVAAFAIWSQVRPMTSLPEQRHGPSRPAEPSPPAVASAPPPSPEPRGRLVIHGTGDVNVDPGYIPTFRTQGYGYAWSGLGGLFRRDDLTVINLECAVSNQGTAVPKEFTFRCDPAALPAMARAGVDVASLANNHSYDFGPEALVDTRRNVERAGMAAVGAGRNSREALAPAVSELDGWRVAVVGFDQVVDPFPDAVATDAKPGTAAGHDTDLMVRTVRRVSRRADVTVVVIHWGVELDTQPRAEQVVLGHRFVDAGADVIFGHHSHRLQPLGSYRGRPIFWSLGNFVWPNFSVEGSTTAVAEVRVTLGGRFRARLIPAFISAPGHPVLQA